MTAAPMTRALDRIYGSPREHLANLVTLYQELYHLPVLSRLFEVQHAQYQMATSSDTFVLVAAFNQNAELLVFRSGSRVLHTNEQRGARILGKQIEDYKSFCLELTANQIVEQNCGSGVAELIPIAFVENEFRCDGKSHFQRGIAFAGHLAGEFVNRREFHFEFVSEPPQEMIFQNREVAELAVAAMRGRQFQPDMEEVAAHRRPVLVQLFHRVVYKPILHGFSSARIRRAIQRHIGNPNSIIDVSAGDDHLIIESCSAHEPDVAVANDISWRQMEPLMREASSRNFYIIFTNHNVAALPYQKVFDVAVCKNTLHHVGTKSEMEAVLTRVGSVARKIIVVDIEDPRRSRRGRLFNWYYTNVLGDAGASHHFLTPNTFRRLLEAAFGDRLGGIEMIETLKGRYMLGVINPAS